MKTVAQKARELLEDLAFENPQPDDYNDEKWFQEDHFDPPHGKSEISYANRKGFIEVGKRGMRLLPYGRQHLKRKKRAGAA